MTIHRESKELPAYMLAIGKNGSRLVEAKPVAGPSGAAVGTSGVGPGRGGPGRGGMMVSAGAGGMTVAADAVPMMALVRMLSQFLRSPVIDNTGLKGNYDIRLTFSPENLGGGPGFGAPPPSGVPSGAIQADPSAEPASPILTVAVQEQLGLKLDKSKGQVEMIVIEHVEKASDN
jgi:uncharacterized protein (TIGR03435 family)